MGLTCLAMLCSALLPLLPSPEQAKGVATLKGHRGYVWCLAFSPDGELLATGSRGVLATGIVDKTVRLWSSLSGVQLATPSASVGDPSPAQAVSPSQRGRPCPAQASVPATILCGSGWADRGTKTPG